MRSAILKALSSSWVTKYPIAILTKAPNKATAQAFTDYVLSPDGASVLTAAGFAKP